jgi:O-antigen ligase
MRPWQMISETMEFVKRAELRPECLVFYCFAGVFLSMPMGTSVPIMLGALGAFICVISGMAFQVKPFLKQSWSWPVLTFIILPWLGLLYADVPAGSGIEYAAKTYYWLFCLALASVSINNRQLRWLIIAFLLGVAINSCAGILQFAGVMAPKEKWFSGLIRGYGTVTVYLVLGILVSAFYFREIEEPRKRAAIAGLMLLYFLHLIILEGRTGYLTFILVSPLIMKTLFRNLRIWKCALLFVLVVGAMFSSPIVKKRVVLTISQLKYHMTAEPDKAWGREYTRQQDRFYMWSGATQIFFEHPIVGVGTGGYPVVLKKARAPGDPLIAHPHNNLLYMAVSYGIFGILAFVWLFGEMIRNAWNLRKEIRGHFILCTAIVIFISGLFNTTILDAGTLLLLSLAAGLQGGLPRFGQNSEDARERPELNRARVVCAHE